MNKKLGADALQIQWRVPEWFPGLGSEVLGQLKAYHTELLRFNKTLNLISAKSIFTADLVHVADSVLASQLICKTAVISDIYDIGSGNGLPGIVYAILCPQTKVHLVEVDQRKAEFLKSAVSALKLRNVEVLVSTVEALPDRSIQFAVSRGFASVSKSILATRRQFAKGGKYFHLKSEEWATEVASIPSQLCSFWLPSLAGEYCLPVGNVKFAVVCTEKIAD